MHYKFTILIVLCITLTNCTKNKFETEKYDNGSIKYKYIKENGHKNGEAYFYKEDGKLRAEYSFLNDTLDGRFIAYFDNGNVNIFKYFSKGKSLLEICFYENNRIQSIVHYVYVAEFGLAGSNQYIEFTKGNAINYKNSRFCYMNETPGKDSISFTCYNPPEMEVDSSFVLFCDYDLNYNLIKSTITDTIPLLRCSRSTQYSIKFYAKFKKKKHHSYKKGIVSFTNYKHATPEERKSSDYTYYCWAMYFSGYPLIQFSNLK